MIDRAVRCLLLGEVDRDVAHVGDRLAHRGQDGVVAGAEDESVETDDRDVRRDAQPWAASAEITPNAAMSFAAMIAVGRSVMATNCAAARSPASVSAPLSRTIGSPCGQIAVRVDALVRGVRAGDARDVADPAVAERA